MNAKTGFKKERLEGQMMNEINSLMRTGLGDPRLSFVSVTKVELTNDLSQAKVYWDTFDAGTRGDAKKAVSKSLGKCKSHLARVLKIRQIPELTAVYDSQFESEKYIEDILRQEAEKEL